MGNSSRGSGKQSWPAGGDTSGFVELGGDLLGDGSVVNAPRVGTLTGVSGVVAVLAGAVLAFGSDPAVSGDAIRTSSPAIGVASAIVTSRNAADTGDNDVVVIRNNSGFNELYIGGYASSGFSVTGIAGEIVHIRSNAAVNRVSVGTEATFTVPIVLPGTVGATGDIRAAQNRTIIGAIYSGVDRGVLATNGSDQLILGQNAASSALAFGNVLIYAQTSVLSLIAGSTITTTSSSTFKTNVPISLAGTTVATVGSIRDVNATTIIAARGSGASDIRILRTDASNNLTIGDLTTCTGIAYDAASASHTFRVAGYVPFTIGAVSAVLGGHIAIHNYTAATTAATVGSVRVENVSTAVAARGAGSYDLALLRTDATDSVYLSDRATATTTYLDATTTIYVRTAAAVPLTVVAVGVAVAGYLAVAPAATGVATIGDIRLANARTHLAADAAGAGDLALLATDASDILYVGATSASASRVAQMYLRSTGSITQEISGVASFIAGSTGVMALQISLGAFAGVAASGSIRAANGTTVVAARGTGAYDLSLLKTDSNSVQVGDLTNVTSVSLRSTTNHYFLIGAVTPLNLTATSATFEGYIARVPAATAVAGIGDFRVGNATTVLAAYRNGTGSLALIATDASNDMWIGVTAAGASAVTTVRVGAPIVMSTGTYISLPGTVAGTGLIRTANNSVIIAGKDAAAADAALLGFDAVDVLNVGGTNVDKVALKGDTQIDFYVGGTLRQSFFSDYMEIPGSSKSKIRTCNGTPEAAVTGDPGDFAVDTNTGGAADAPILYVKVTGFATNTGWRSVAYV